MAWYNGIFLPDLPEYDTAAYPYACIQWVPYTGGGYITHLRYSNKPFHAAAGAVSNTPGATVLVQTFVSVNQNFAWGTAYSLPRPSLSLRADTVIWCNADIAGEDGAVFLAASEPVPTHAGSMPDFRITGWLIGTVLGLASKLPLPAEDE